MKLVKKLISAVCALGMIATMTSALVVQAAESPTVKIELTEYNEDTNIGMMTVKVQGLDKSVDERAEDLFVAMIQIGIQMPKDIFDASYYTTGKGGQLSTNVKMGERFTSDVTGPAYNVIDGVDTIAATFMTNSLDPGKMLNIYNGDDISDITYMTIKFHKLTDDPVDMSELFGNVMVTTRHYDAAWTQNQFEQTSFGNMKDCAVANFDAPEIDPIKVVGPVIQSVGDGPFTATGDEAEVMPDQRAAAAIAEIPAVGEDDTYNAVKWTITVDGSQYDKTFGLANLDASADMKMGLIVEYSTNDATSVTIDKAEYATVTE